MSNLVTDKPTLNDYWEALICEGIDTWHVGHVALDTCSHPSTAARWCARGRLTPRWSPRAPAPWPPRRGSCTCRGRLLQCHPLLYSIGGVEWSFIQNCVDIYIYLCKYDIPCIAAPGQPSAQIKNKKYLLRPKLFTGTTREVSLPPPPYPSIKTK